MGPEWAKENIKAALSAQTYIKNIVKKNAEMCGKGTFKSQKSPMAEEYHPEEDQSNLLDEGGISKYCVLIGTANWIITLGRFDIAYAVNTLSRYSAAPREGHLKALMRIFSYLDTYPTGRILIDTKLHDRTQYTLLDNLVVSDWTNEVTGHTR